MKLKKVIAWVDLVKGNTNFNRDKHNMIFHLSLLDQSQSGNMCDTFQNDMKTNQSLILAILLMFKLWYFCQHCVEVSTELNPVSQLLDACPLIDRLAGSDNDQDLRFCFCHWSWPSRFHSYNDRYKVKLSKWKFLSVCELSKVNFLQATDDELRESESDIKRVRVIWSKV